MPGVAEHPDGGTGDGPALMHPLGHPARDRRVQRQITPAPTVRRLHGEQDLFQCPAVRAPGAAWRGLLSLHVHRIVLIGVPASHRISMKL
jgi:hypothetical protein